MASFGTFVNAVESSCHTDKRAPGDLDANKENLVPTIVIRQSDWMRVNRQSSGLHDLEKDEGPVPSRKRRIPNASSSSSSSKKHKTDDSSRSPQVRDFYTFVAVTKSNVPHQFINKFA